MKLVRDPSLYPIFKKRIYEYMTHRYVYQKDITYNKAKEYVNTGKIYGFKCNSDCTTFTAKCKGSNDNIYSCRLILENKRIEEFTCTCPSYTKWHTLCKHLVGMMILVEKTRRKLLNQKTVLKSSHSDAELSGKDSSIKDNSAVSTVVESNLTRYTCANCGTKYGKDKKKCPLCGNSITENEAISKIESNRVAEANSQIPKEKQEAMVINNSLKKEIKRDNPSYSNKSKEATSNEKHTGCIIAIAIYIVISIVLGLIGGNIVAGFILSAIFFTIIFFIIFLLGR